MKSKFSGPCVEVFYGQHRIYDVFWKYHPNEKQDKHNSELKGKLPSYLEDYKTTLHAFL